MRRVALVALLACAGCDAILGLKSTVAADAADASLAPQMMTLSWLNLQSGTQDTIMVPGIDGATISVGVFDDKGLTSIDARSIDSNGVFPLPFGLTDPFRVVFTIPLDPVPLHEVQWSATAGAHFTVPLFGTAPHRAPPPGSGYAIGLDTPDAAWTCGASSCSFPVGFAVTGAWYEGTGHYDTSGTNNPQHEVTAVLSNLTPLGGPPATPHMSSGDLGIVIDFDSTFAPHAAKQYAFASVDMMNGVLTTDDMQPFVSPSPTTFVFGIDFDTTQTRIQSALGSLATGTWSPLDASRFADTTAAGVIPDAGMPAMPQPAVTGALDDPVMLVLNDQEFTQVSTMLTGSFPAFAPPGDLPLRPPALRYREFVSRPAGDGSIQLASGYQEVTTTPGATLDFAVGIATQIKFAGDFLAGDGATIPLPAAPFADLAFDVEAAQAANTYDCVVTSFEVGTSALMPIRSITVAAAASGSTIVKEPTADFQSGHSYAFSIVCRNTYPSAATSDYTKIASYPHSESQIFPGTFVVQ